MISNFAAPTMIATVFCIGGWTYLTYKNVKDKRAVFSIACFSSILAYIFASAQYILIFYIDKTPQAATPMWLLFLRMMFHVNTVLIFCYNYNFSLNKK